MRTSEHYTADLLVYFEGHDREHALYLALVSALEQTLPENFSVRVQKSQISFYGRHLFGAASIPVRRKKDRPPDCLMVTFGLEHRADSPRIAVATEPYPNRWRPPSAAHRPGRDRPAAAGLASGGLLVC